MSGYANAANTLGAPALGQTAAIKYVLGILGRLRT